MSNKQRTAYNEQLTAMNNEQVECAYVRKGKECGRRCYTDAAGSMKNNQTETYVRCLACNKVHHTLHPNPSPK